jgi:hypothetical protein
MKSLCIPLFILVILIISSCNNNSKEVARLKATIDTLQNQLKISQQKEVKFSKISSADDYKGMLNRKGKADGYSMPSVSIKAKTLKEGVKDFPDADVVNVTIAFQGKGKTYFLIFDTLTHCSQWIGFRADTIQKPCCLPPCPPPINGDMFSLDLPTMEPGNFPDENIK